MATSHGNGLPILSVTVRALRSIRKDRDACSNDAATEWWSRRYGNDLLQISEFLLGRLMASRERIGELEDDELRKALRQAVAYIDKVTDGNYHGSQVAPPEIPRWRDLAWTEG